MPLPPARGTLRARPPVEGPAPTRICGERQSVEASLDTATGALAGTLEIPAGCSPFPVALIYPGSGPTDRNGNSESLPGRNDSLKMLAEALADGGIASVRVDKRGLAGSRAAGPADERSLRFATFVDDAAGWLRWLSTDVRFQGQVMIGHSEGSLIGLLAAQQVPVRAVVSLAGAGRPAGDVLREQFAAQVTGELLARANQIIAELEAGREVAVADIPPPLRMIFPPSVQPYLIEWFAHDPAAILGKLTARAQVVQGTTDLQVSVADARILAAARPDVELRLLEGMNHVLKLVGGGLAEQLPSYSDPALPLAPGLADAMIAFIKATP